MTRAGIWVNGHLQLELPVHEIEVHGLGTVLRASGHLRFTPDYEVFSWVCEKWLDTPEGDEAQQPAGWVRLTLYELGMVMRGSKPDSGQRRALRESLTRIAMVKVKLIGWDGRANRQSQLTEGYDNLFDRVYSKLDRIEGDDRRAIGALRGSTFEVQLPPWIMAQLRAGNVARVPWATLRSFDERERLAKRLFVYLCAENWKPQDGGKEATWMRLGDRFYATLGMAYQQLRNGRPAVARAAQTVLWRDARMTVLELRARGRHGRHVVYDLYAERWQWAAFRPQRDELERARAQTRALLLGAKKARP